MIKRVLVALSGTPYTPVAVQHALDLAQRHHAEATGVTVTDLARLANVGPVPVGAGAAAAQLADHRILITEERMRETIETFRGACREASVNCAVEKETCSPLDELKSLWRYHDITVFGLRGLFEYGVVHNPDDKVLRLIKHGVRPILAVAREFRPIKRVLIAYNGSMESAKAMKRFMQMDLWPDPTIKIVCYGSNREKSQKLLDDAAAYCRLWNTDPETEHLTTEPKRHFLDDAANWNADLIVMGSTRRMRLFQHVLGDLVLHVVRDSDVPVFLTQ